MQQFAQRSDLHLGALVRVYQVKACLLEILHMLPGHGIDKIISDGVAKVKQRVIHAVVFGQKLSPDPMASLRHINRALVLGLNRAGNRSQCQQERQREDYRKDLGAIFHGLNIIQTTMAIRNSSRFLSGLHAVRLLSVHAGIFKDRRQQTKHQDAKQTHQSRPIPDHFWSQCIVEQTTKKRCHR
ncbi:hypothetical protein SDC9_197017 [bioreactor metagenome]|uniref:Uncharacterized protein n=1 Tax=bioreactor metagenome TaxID=1076179 RepID=A0A645IEM2_9ZZZZ